MKMKIFFAAGIVFAPVALNVAAQAPVKTGSVDFESYVQDSIEAYKWRDQRLVNEEVFMRMAQESGTVVLDARSAERYGYAHVRGAINLNFADITEESLKRLFPDKGTRILIYCNNNFKDSAQDFAPRTDPFPSKIARAALNIPTFITLYSYGYRNVYQLNSEVKPSETKLDLVGSSVKGA